MARSLFCVCSPGATQDTTRFFRAILKGCIPVTFFRCPDLCPVLLAVLCSACPVLPACPPVAPADKSVHYLCSEQALQHTRFWHCRDMVLPAWGGHQWVVAE